MNSIAANPHLKRAKASFMRFIDFSNKTLFSPYSMGVSALSCLRSVWIPAFA
jgi:hypothetical protein